MKYLFHSLELHFLLIAILVGILAADVVLAAHHEIYRDEVVAWRLSSLDLADTVAATGQVGWPPLYYVVLHLWSSVFGDSIFALRSLSILCGIITTLCGFLLTKLAIRDPVVGSRCGLVVAVLIAISPFRVEEMIRANPAALQLALAFMLTYSAALFVVGRSSENAESPKGRSKPFFHSGLIAGLYGCIAFAFALSFEGGWAIAVAQFVVMAAILIYEKGYSRIPWLLIPAVLLVAFPLFFSGVIAADHSYVIEFSRLGYLSGPADVVLGPTGTSSVWILLPLAVTIAGLCFLRFRSSTFIGLLLAASLGVVIYPLATTRFDAPLVSCIVMPFGIVGLICILNTDRFRPIFPVACLAIFAFSCARGQALVASPTPGAAAAAQIVVDHRQEGDLVVARKQYLFHTMKFYLRQTDLKFLDSGNSNVLFDTINSYSGVQSISRDELAKQHSGRLWYIFTSGTLNTSGLFHPDLRLVLFEEVNTAEESFYVSLYEPREQKG